ncbi:MAG TPA: dTMP kinase [Candidatus Eisenbacteria bacterium]|nr:dTMP kinase [Candidatus Eisenbacteria bacterium]
MSARAAKPGKSWFGHGLPYMTMGSLPGHLIVIEGTDSVGRSTQIERLSPWLELEGYAVSNTGWTRSPLLSETINEAKAGHELTTTTMSLLYAADFADRVEHQIIPALKAGFIVIADRYMYTVFARNAVMGMDAEWTRQLFGMALVPDLVLYLEIDVEHLIPRVLEGKGMDYWESGMHLALGSDIFDSFTRYQTQLIEEYNRLGRHYHFTNVDARRSIDEIQTDLRTHISSYLQRSREREARRTRASLRASDGRARRG